MRIHTIAVGVPARDEADTVVACLTGLLAAAARVDVDVCVAVAADRCRDDTEPRVRAMLESHATGNVTGVVVRTDHGRAGAARSAAIDAALALAVGPMDGVWIATTDADTVVHPSWMATHLSWARTGADGIAGLVDVDWPAESEHLAARYLASISDGGLGAGHRHVHGANLGLTATWWRAVGGCGTDAVGEDHELWSRLQRMGAITVGVDDLHVTTSARLDGRTPAGFARYLRDLTGETEERPVH